MPLYYFHDGLRSIIIHDNVSGAGLAFLILGIFAAIFMFVAIRVTKWKEL
ncbi:MAG: hypothetical protein AB1665_02915 [Candidatus Thermoplasmatota archaeon]